MVWLVEKKILYHILDLGFESVRIPIRVKFEFEIREGSFVSKSISVHHLYNKQALQKRYPNLKAENLDRDIGKTVKKEIFDYLKSCGFINENEDMNSTDMTQLR